MSKKQIITHQNKYSKIISAYIYCFLNFSNFLFINIITMASHIKNLLKQLPFYEKTIKTRIKEFTSAKLLSMLPFFEKSIKAKIKQLTTKKLLQE